MFQVNNVCVVNISGSSNAALKPEFDLWQKFCFIHVQLLYFCILLAVVTSFKFDESYQLRFGEVWTEERGRRLASGRVTTVRATQSTEAVLYRGPTLLYIVRLASGAAIRVYWVGNNAGSILDH